jgi:hypothetical protein
MILWKVHCEENKFPGMWQRWFKNQCVAVGWASQEGYHLHGKTKSHSGWSVVRKAIKKINVGDQIIVTLKDHRVGRLGVVTGKRIEDHEWKPLVPKSPRRPWGGIGRRIQVLWENAGPPDRDKVVFLPTNARLNSGELHGTIRQIRSQSIDTLRKAMNDPLNWVGLLTHFAEERALSDFIAAYPHKLEDGLLPHPDKRVREKIFPDKKRSDVLLEDQKGVPVVVECKQGSPRLKDLKQLRHYMKHLRGEARGILVHGGARKLSADIVRAARKRPKIEIVKYSLDVDFSTSD